MKKVKVIRSFMVGGVAQKVGSVIAIPDSVAADVIASTKAELVTEDPEVKPEPKRKKGEKDAG